MCISPSSSTYRLDEASYETRASVVPNNQVPQGAKEPRIKGAVGAGVTGSLDVSYISLKSVAQQEFADSTGGGRRRGRHRRLLFWVDLMAIMERAGQRKAGELALRDRTIMGLSCGSALRIQEIADLQWESLDWHPEGEAKLFPVWATVERRGAPVQLPIYFRVVPSLIALRDAHQGLDCDEPSSAIFRELRRDPFSGLKYRRIKSIFDTTVANAGFRGASLLDLKAAFADHLIHAHKISEDRMTRLLGYALHESTLDVIREHKIWRLNRARADKAAQSGESS